MLMRLSLVKDYIVEWVRRDIAVGVYRELKVPRRKDKIISIIGPRRAGKTYYFYQLMKERREHSLYLNFEDLRLMDVDFREIRDLVRIYVEVVGWEPSNVLFDEVQNLNGWEKALRGLLDLQRYNIFATGSSSKLLSREVATQLRGRTFSYILLPFSFREFLKARNVTVSEPLTMDEAARVKNLLRSYLEFGGFPEVVFEDAEKERILKEYSEMILFRDIVERHKLRNISLARFLLSFFIQNFSREFSVNKVLKTAGLESFGKNTLYSYVDRVQDSVAIFFLNRFSPRVYQRESWPKKVYLCDTGLTKTVRFSENVGKLMENVVFLELLRLMNRRPMLEIYYWKNSQQGEVDFLLKEGMNVKQLVQVTYAMERDEVEKREIKSLLEASEKTNCNNLLVVTWDYEGEDKSDGKTVKFIPLWKWLLTT
ncbi:ATP-binding protein [Candidatus Bathyarchaeota archaeon]|nr:ATP-binding protein [Candidatus Bathyarchaeota archaeon]MBS7613866.1 ATP-binding protein [Candidatus Bathyarchaeota archaeon]MBS7617882.1 ATP-binding protein [Candidatus Bathyarchaeota archaeon]